MTTGTPVQSVKEHKKITDEIDDVYMQTVYAATKLDAFVVSGVGGNRREYFLLFYENFFGLVSHTRNIKGVEETGQGSKDAPTLMEEIDGWFLDSKHPKIKKRNFPPEFIQDGLLLFKEYQKRILRAGVITITR